MNFNYHEFTTRNIGFISKDEQNKLQQSTIFIAGTGGMGGAAIACLARSGVSNFIIADIDVFEISNLNRQIFANLDTINQDKAKSTRDALLKINPEIKIKIYDGSWTEKLDEILPHCDLAINGCDDIKATLKLMRKARDHNKTVIDAFASPLPSVYTIGPKDPRPEVTFKYPTLNKKIDELSEEEVKECAFQEIVYVLTHSSSSKHVILEIAAEIVSGKRSRISLAPMVWTTGCLMTYEALKILLNKPKLANHRGIFFNPWEFKIERPYGKLIGFFRRILVINFLKKMIK